MGKSFDKFTLTDKEWKSCRDFALKESEDSWEVRHQRASSTTKAKTINTSHMGKCAELITYKTIVSFLGEVLELPDLKIYDVKDKSFSADLQIVNRGKTWNFHVKSCELSSNWEPSWLFTKKDELTHSPEEEDIVCFVVMDAGYRSGRVYRFRRATWIFPDVVAEPKNADQKNSKYAIYKSRIEAKELKNRT